MSQIAETLLCSKKGMVCHWIVHCYIVATTDSSVETPFEPGFMRPTPPLHRIDDEVRVPMTVDCI